MSMIITNAGRNAVAAALANNVPITVAEIAFGTENRYPTGGETALTAEVIRKPVMNYGTTEDGKTYFDARLEADDGPFVLYEIGLFDGDGTLLFVGRIEGFNKLVMANQPVTLDMRAYVLTSQFQNVVVQIDTSFAFVSAERKLLAGDGLSGGGDLSQDRTVSLDPDLLARFESDLLPEGDREAGDMLRISEEGEPEWVPASGLLGGSSLDGPASIYAGTSAEYVITDYHAFTAYVVTATRGTVARDAERITLTLDAGEAAGPLTVTVDRGGSETTVEIAVLANIVVPPSIDAPTNGATGVGAAPSLATSAFASIPDGADTHASTDWQIATDASFANVIWEALASADLELTSVPSGTLEVGTTYYVRARHNGDTLGASGWSAGVSFTTAVAFVPSAEVQVITGFQADNDVSIQLSGDWLAGVNAAETDVLVYQRTGGSFVFESSVPTSKSADVSRKTFGLDYPWLAVPSGADTKVYRHEGGAWVEKQTIAGNTRIMMRDGRLVIATGLDAKVYELVADVWTETATVTGPDTIDILDINGDRLLVGHKSLRSNFYQLQAGGWVLTGYYNASESHAHTFAINGDVAAYRDLASAGFLRIVNPDANNQQYRKITGPSFNNGVTIDAVGHVYTVNNSTDDLLVYHEGDGSWPLLVEIPGTVPSPAHWNHSIAQSNGTVAVASNQGSVHVFS